jgi:pyruvate kinase
MAKIELPEAIDNLESIAAASDALMVARGDLAVELGIEKLAGAQLKIIVAAKKYGIPVTVATDVLGGMMLDGSPTRSNALDVAHAVYLGANSVMTSGETASDVPGAAQAAVKMMHELLVHSESTMQNLNVALTVQGNPISGHQHRTAMRPNRPAASSFDLAQNSLSP